jgi:hypothetical protein
MRTFLCNTMEFKDRFVAPTVGCCFGVFDRQQSDLAGALARCGLRRIQFQIHDSKRTGARPFSNRVSRNRLSFANIHRTGWLRTLPPSGVDNVCQALICEQIQWRTRQSAAVDRQSELKSGAIRVSIESVRSGIVFRIKRCPFVTMVKSTDFRNLNDVSQCRRLDYSRVWRVLLQRQMGS